MQSAYERIPLKTATERVAAELNGLHSRLERLEYGLDMVFVHTSAEMDTQTVGMLQELDMLRQSLGALTDFAKQIAADTDALGSVNVEDAIEKVPLRDMAVRLAGHKNADAETGHAELF